MDAPMPELSPGYTSRPVDPDGDVEAILDLTREAAIAEYGVPDVDERMVRNGFRLPGFDPVRDSLLVLDPRGKAVVLGGFFDSEELHIAPFFLFRMRPNLPDPAIADHVLRWGAARAPQNAKLAPEGARVAMHTETASVNREAITALERAGWRHERTNWIMEIDLQAAAPLPEPAWPEGITVRSAKLEQDARAVHAAEADAFSDHYGYVPQGFDEWFHFRTQFMTAEPDLWILAMDGDEIAGMALCSSQRPGQPDLGWVSTLGVRRPWRRRGLALAILQHAFRLLADRGKPRAGLGVDSQSLTGATRLYEKAGMRVVREGYDYALLIRDGRDLRTLELAEESASA
jgi:ribosomal protein S18 acetylase RimI-like enzyme